MARHALGGVRDAFIFFREPQFLLNSGLGASGRETEGAFIVVPCAWQSAIALRARRNEFDCPLLGGCSCDVLVSVSRPVSRRRGHVPLHGHRFFLLSSARNRAIERSPTYAARSPLPASLPPATVAAPGPSITGRIRIWHPACL